MSIKMKKPDLAIVFAGLALMLAGMLAGCQPDVLLPALAPQDGGLDTGNSGGTGDFGRGSRIEIYLDGDESRNRAGETLTWLYDGLETNHPETPRRITGKVINAEAGYDRLVWTISPNTSTTNGIMNFQAGFRSAAYSYITDPKANGTSFDIYAGGRRGTARLTVVNSTAGNRPGGLSAFITIAIVDRLPSLEVFVTETKQVSNIGFVPADAEDGHPRPPQWAVRDSNLATLSASNDEWRGPPDPGRPVGGYYNAIVTLTGLQGGPTSYFARSWSNGAERITEGPLTVIASTTWYVGPGAAGTYGFTLADKIPLNTALTNMTKYYLGSPGITWPRKGAPNEQRAVIRFTGDEPGSFIILGNSEYPVNIDLVNDLSYGQQTISGRMKAGAGKNLTMDAIKVTGDVVIDQGAGLTMLTLPTEIIGGNVEVAGDLVMNNGTVGNAATVVQTTGTFTLNNGTISNTTTNVQKSGISMREEFFPEPGIPNSSSREVRPPPAFTMRGGSISGGSVTLEAGRRFWEFPRYHVEVGGTFNMAGGTLNSNTLEVREYSMFTMTGGTLGTAQTTVRRYGYLTVNNTGRVNGKVDVYGTFTMNAGTTFNSERTDVLSPGGKLTLKNGTFVTSTSRVYINGDQYITNWPPPSPLPYDITITAP
ncbi:hypothetical protein FACS189473_0310 [Spirochaetia bacterium]|nr:hypothetical protein FACS189473_0310 [Spirochaetia bacterium]